MLNYVKEHFNCSPQEVVNPDTPIPFPDIDLPLPDPGSNDHLPDDDDYDEDQRKPIWWYHTDHLGSSTYLTDNFGRPSHYYETLPFGEMMVEHNQSANVPSGVGYDNKWKFNGKELDDATQMYYYGARYYDPRVSIFVSVDPLAEQTMTPYQYVHNNPINLIDPTGMSAESCEIDPPKKEKPRSANEQGVINVGKKYLATAVATATDPIGTAINMFADVSKELADFTFQDKGDVVNFATRKGTNAYNSLQNRVKGSQDPGYEFKVAMAELQTEVIINILLSKGISTVAGKLGTSGGIANTFGGALDDVAKFGSKSEGLGHFGKHGTSVQNALGRASYNYGDYLTDANFIIKNGTYVPEMNGYVRLMGGKGSAKFGFVGLNRQTGNITTFHVKTAKELAKSAPGTFKY